MIFVVGDSDSGIRLDVFVHRQLDEHASRNDAQALIKTGAVRLDGNVVTKAATRLQTGNGVEFDVPKEASNPNNSPEPQVIEFVVVHEDEHIAVIDKPIGLPVHPGAGHQDETLVNGLVKRWPNISGVGKVDRPGIVHRLDMDTSGLLVVALSEQAYSVLSKQMRNHEVSRTYTALVRGIPEPDRGVIDAPIGRDPNNRLKQAIITTGREARTQYEVVEKYSNHSLLKIKLETGRMHQIRVHMTALGTPVVGDQTYGKSSENLNLYRQFLHASELSFEHPVTGERLTFASPLPDDLSEVLKLVRT